MSAPRNYIIMVGSKPTDDPRPRYHWVLTASDAGECVSASGHQIPTLSASTYATPAEAIQHGEHTNRHYNAELVARAREGDRVAREARN